MNRTYSICLWGAWYGSRNAGDQAILLSMARLLSDRLQGVRLTVFSNNPEHIERYTAEGGVAVRALHKWRQLPQVVRTLAGADVFLIGGGVPFYDKPVHVLTFSFLAVLAKLLGCRVMVYAAASRSLRRPFSRFIYRWLLGWFDVVTVRDPRTLRELSGLKPKRTILLTADPALTLERAQPERVRDILLREGVAMDPTRPLIGITTRQLSSHHPYREDHYRQIPQEAIGRFQEAMATVVDFLTTLGRVCFIPMHTAGPDDDRVMARGIMSRMTRASEATALSQQYSPSELMGLIGECSFLLASRLHSMIFAAASAVPFVTVAYDPKLLGMAESLHMEEFAHDLVDVEPDALLASVKQGWEQREHIRQRLSRRVEELQGLARHTADLAVRLCQGDPTGRRP